MTAFTTPIQIRRIDDLEWVGRFVESTTYQCILNVFSVYGYGKSNFFLSIAERYQAQIPVAILSVLSFEPKNQDSPYDMSALFLDFWNQWAKYLNIQKEISTEPTPQQMIQELASLLDGFQGKELTPFLIIDDFHKLPNGSRAIFEDLLAVFLKSPRQVRVILGSEQKINFLHRLDLQSRLINYRLSPLEEKDLFISDTRYQEVISEILKWTGGMPKLIEFLSQSISMSKEEQHDIANKYRQIWGTEEYYKKIQWAGFRDVKKATSIALDAISLARRFDVTMLSDILPILDYDHYSSFKEKDYLDLIFELGGRKRWRDQGGGYELDPVLKSVLAEYIQANRSDEYKLIHQVIADAYNRRLENNEFRLHYITEALFHFLELAKIETADNEELIDKTSNRLMDYVTEYNYFHDRQPTQRIDHLDELRNTLDEDICLRPFIRTEVLERISNILHNEQ